MRESVGIITDFLTNYMPLLVAVFAITGILCGRYFRLIDSTNIWLIIFDTMLSMCLGVAAGVFCVVMAFLAVAFIGEEIKNGFQILRYALYALALIVIPVWAIWDAYKNSKKSR